MTDNDNSDLENSIYLAGSFNNGAREIIIKRAPKQKFTNPINNPQSAMYLTNYHDLKAARVCPAVAGLFPKGKTPGTMTFVELGMAYDSQGRIYSAFENQNIKSKELELVEKISKKTFGKVEDLGDYLNAHSFKSNGFREVKENLGEVKSVFVIGDENKNYLHFVDNLEKNIKNTKLNYKTKNIFENIQTVKNSDVIALRWDRKYDRENCFLIGIALANKIPIIMKDASPIPYPPLAGGLQRRTFNSEKAMIEYIGKIENNAISKESMIMYELFPKYNK